MAEKKAVGTTFDAVMRDLRAGKYAPVYVLMGEESYYIDQITDFIAANALREEERDFNQTVVFGADVNAGNIADLARRYPMMAERQVVIVKEAQNIKNWDRLETYLVIAHKNGKIDGRKKILTVAQKVGVVFESKKKRDYELPAFIEAYLREKGFSIDNKSAQMIAEYIGADLSRLTSELDKVVLSFSDDEPKKVTPDVVERQIGVSKEFNGFELKNALAERDILKANRIVDYFDKNPKSGSAYMLVPLLFNYFQNLMWHDGLT